MDAKRGPSSLDGQGGSKKRHRSEGNAASTAPQEEMISSQASNAVDPSKDNSEVDRLVRLLGNPEVKEKLGLVTKADLGNPEVKKELGLVSMADHEQLKSDHEQLNSDHEQLKSDHDQLKSDHEKLEESTGQLKYRMDGIAKAFEPATQHAFFETVIYKFCHASVSVIVQREQVEKAQHAMSVVAKEVLKHLWTEDCKRLSLQIPGFGRRNHPGNPNAQAWEKSVVKMLQGLTEFLNYSKREVIDDLVANGQDHRNTVSHNGEFLKSLFGSPKKDPTVLYEEKKTQLKEGMSHFEDMIEQTGPSTLKNALKDVSDAIRKKRSIENDGSLELSEEKVLQALKNLLQIRS